MGGHVVRSLASMAVTGSFRGKPAQSVREIRQNARIGVFLDAERRRGVGAKHGQETILSPHLFQTAVQLPAETIKAGSGRSDGHGAAAVTGYGSGCAHRRPLKKPHILPA